jgi:hypothetical protein
MPDQSMELTFDRRERFRTYMKAFNPTAPARAVIQAGLVLEDLHHSLYSNLAGRADLEPGSQQLVVGGIGSGKTTELLLAEQWLRNQTKALCLYIDVTSETDLAGLNSGALLASFGVHLANAARELENPPTDKTKENREMLRDFAYGKTVRYWVDEDAPEPDFDDYDPEPPTGYYVTNRLPGKLNPPLPALQRDIADIRAPLNYFLGLIRQQHEDVVVIFDGLDRLITTEKFLSVVHQDFRALRTLAVSLLATAPVSIYGAWQAVSERFDRVQPLPVIPAGAENDGFLRSVLARRGALKLMDPPEADGICRYSGGVLRDLIALARDAAEEAYIAGSDRIRLDDVKKVTAQLGEAYLRGLGPTQIKSLKDLEKTKAFNLQDSTNMELLVTRRVLEYSPTDFRVHPALLPLLTQTEKADA